MFSLAGLLASEGFTPSRSRPNNRARLKGPPHCFSSKGSKSRLYAEAYPELHKLLFHQSWNNPGTDCFPFAIYTEPLQENKLGRVNFCLCGDHISYLPQGSHSTASPLRIMADDQTTE